MFEDSRRLRARNSPAARSSRAGLDRCRSQIVMGCRYREATGRRPRCRFTSAPVDCNDVEELAAPGIDACRHHSRRHCSGTVRAGRPTLPPSWRRGARRSPFTALKHALDATIASLAAAGCRPRRSRRAGIARRSGAGGRAHRRRRVRDLRAAQPDARRSVVSRRAVALARRRADRAVRGRLAGSPRGRCAVTARHSPRLRARRSGGRVHAASRHVASRRTAVAPSPDDVALVLHTSGTTAQPKAVPLTHRLSSDRRWRAPGSFA